MPTIARVLRRAAIAPASIDLAINYNAFLYLRLILLETRYNSRGRMLWFHLPRQQLDGVSLFRAAS
jgi:hypothetical protein